MNFKLMTATCAISALLIACSEPAPEETAVEDAAVEVETVAEAQAAPDYAAILTADDRSQEDKDRDAGRHPAEAMALMGVMPGNTIIDIGAGSGFYSEVFARAIGEGGLVHAVNYPSSIERFVDMHPALEARAAAVGPATIHPMAMELADMGAYGADVAFMGQMYHEVIRQNMDAEAINAAVFNALKLGGIYAIEIHNAEAGSGREVSETFHRADPDIVRAEVLAAGFELVEENTELLGNADDPLNVMVFDPSIRGSTSRTLFIFKKPE